MEWHTSRSVLFLVYKCILLCLSIAQQLTLLKMLKIVRFIIRLTVGPVILIIRLTYRTCDVGTSVGGQTPSLRVCSRSQSYPRFHTSNGFEHLDFF